MSLKLKKKKKKLVYVANTVFPNNSAKNIQIIKNCSELSQHFDLTLVTLSHKNSKEIFNYYSLEKTFKINAYKKFKSYILCEFYLLFQALKSKSHYVFTRNLLTALMLSPIKKVVYEIHDLQKSKIWVSLFNITTKLTKHNICVNKEVFRLVKAGNKSLLFNGFDKEKFENLPNKNTLREQLKIPKNKTIFTYTGHLYQGRGIENILDLAEKYKKIIFLIIGGTKSDILRYKRKSKNFNNVHFTGFLNNSLIPKYLTSSDLLLAPYTNQVSTINQMCPMKIVEYMASGTPILVSNWPRIHDLVGNNVIYFKESSSEDMINKAELFLKNKKKFQDLANKLKKKSVNFSIATRAKKIAKIILK